MPEGGEFGWQHDLRRQPDGAITIYDNHENATETDAVSAALRFELDEEAMTATLVQALRHEDRYGYAMGNAAVPRGRARARRVGDGPLRHRVRRGRRGGLRAVRPRARLLPVLPLPVARPAGHPARPRGRRRVGVRLLERRHGGGGLAGARRSGRPSRLAPVGEVPRAGFETTVALESGARVVRAEALDADGRVLGRTRTVRA